MLVLLGKMSYIIYRKLREILISKKDNENENDVFEPNE